MADYQNAGAGVRPMHQLQEILDARQRGERRAHLVFAIQGLSRLLSAQRGTAVHLGAGWQLAIQPGCHTLRLLFAARTQGSEHIVADQFQVDGFGMSPKHQVHSAHA